MNSAAIVRSNLVQAAWYKRHKAQVPSEKKKMRGQTRIESERTRTANEHLSILGRRIHAGGVSHWHGVSGKKNEEERGSSRRRGEPRTSETLQMERCGRVAWEMRSQCRERTVSIQRSGMEGAAQADDKTITPVRSAAWWEDPEEREGRFIMMVDWGSAVEWLGWRGARGAPATQASCAMRVHAQRDQTGRAGGCTAKGKIARTDCKDREESWVGRCSEIGGAGQRKHEGNARIARWSWKSDRADPSEGVGTQGQTAASRGAGKLGRNTSVGHHRDARGRGGCSFGGNEKAVEASMPGRDAGVDRRSERPRRCRCTDVI
ncbi:hypothetical protein B0H13DRAFT_1870399 [Mycena leptocephala]|nr:hypothetical protein B0H13DRAFT_1870399 [Mycena leptocephala]